MESFSLSNKQYQLAQSRGDFQQGFRQPHYSIHPIPNPHRIATYQQKAPFLTYASSLLEIATEEQSRTEQIPVIEQSELINPPESLIKKYQTMRKERPSCGNLSCESVRQNSRSMKKIENGLAKLAVFLQHRIHKSHFNTQNKPIQSLIDILSFSSVSNLSRIDEKILLKESFLKLKSLFYRTSEKTKPSKPLIPIDKKKMFQHQNKQQNTLLKQLLSLRKKQGAEHLVGSLTFKVLVIESQCFKLIKTYVYLEKIMKLIHSITRIFKRHGFNKIYQIFLHSPSRIDSKILTLSKSKSKSSFSKLKVHATHSQKKIGIQNQHSHGDEQLTENNQFNQRVVNSQILQNFDFTQFKSKINDEDVESSDRKIAFNNKLKKKNSKQSMSQAETINSKRSIQSEYQFAQGVSSKVSTCRKPISVKNFSRQDHDALEEIPTQKFIRKKKNQQKFDFHKNLFIQEIAISQALKPFKKEERRYLNIRTNLFQLPLSTQFGYQRQFQSRKLTKKEQMQKIYHLMSDGLMKNEPLEDQKDSLIMNLNKMILPQFSKDLQIEKEAGHFNERVERQSKKTKIKNSKDIEKMQKYYNDLGIDKNHKKPIIDMRQTKNDLGIQNPQSFQKKPLMRKLKTQQSQLTSSLQILEPSQSLIYKNNKAKNFFHESTKPEAGNEPQDKEKRSPRLKTKKTDNFQEYYFKAQMKNGNPIASQAKITDRQLPSKSKLIKPVNSINHQVSTQPLQKQIVCSKEFYETQYRTSKLISQLNSTKNAKSLSPNVKFSLQSPYRTGKLGSKVIQQNTVPNQMFINNEQNPGVVTFISQPSKIFSKTGDSKLEGPINLPIEQQSSGMSTPRSIHQFVSNGNPSIVRQNKSKSKLKVFSQTPRSLSPQQNQIMQHWFATQNSERKTSFVVNAMPQKVVTIGNRPPSNNVFLPTEGSVFTPTNSNLSNQSGFTQNIHRVINYGPNIGFGQQMNRPSSILSTHSNQSKQKIIIGKSSQQLLSPTQRQMHMMMGGIQVVNMNQIPSTIGFSQQSPRVHQGSMMANSPRRGLNVMVGGDRIMGDVQRPSPNTSLTKLNQFTRPKSITNQKIFVTVRK